MSNSIIRPVLSALLVGLVSLSAISNAATIPAKNVAVLKTTQKQAQKQDIVSKVKGKKAHFVSMAKPTVTKTGFPNVNRKKSAQKSK